jgi:hypothetical protein
MPDSVRGICGDAPLGLFLVLVDLMGWPDWELPDLLCKGMPVIDFVPPSNLFKQKVNATELSAEALENGVPELGVMDNDTWNQALTADTRWTDNDALILEMTKAEIAKGKATGPFSKREMDAMFGQKKWRGTRRRILYQEAQDKYRAIDNCKTSYTNKAADMWETLVTPAHDIAMKTAIRLAKVMGAPLKDIWQLVLGCEDMEDAYRSIPNRPSNLPFCVVAFLDENGIMKFAVFQALLFGQAAALITLIAFPIL